MNADKSTPQLRRKADFRLAKVYGAVASNTILVSAYNIAWASLLGAKAPEFKDFLWDWAKGVVGLSFVGNIMSGIVDSIKNKLNGLGFREAALESPPVHVITTGMDAAANLTVGFIHAVNGEGDWQKDLTRSATQSAELIMMSRGLPYYGPASLAKAVGNYVELDSSSGITSLGD